MGFFSCYMGLLYNEWFAIPYAWFDSCYDTNIGAPGTETQPAGYDGSPDEYNFQQV